LSTDIGASLVGTEAALDMNIRTYKFVAATIDAGAGAYMGRSGIKPDFFLDMRVRTQLQREAVFSSCHMSDTGVNVITCIQAILADICTSTQALMKTERTCILLDGSTGCGADTKTTGGATTDAERTLFQQVSLTSGASVHAVFIKSDPRMTISKYQTWQPCSSFNAGVLAQAGPKFGDANIRTKFQRPITKT